MEHGGWDVGGWMKGVGYMEEGGKGGPSSRCWRPGYQRNTIRDLIEKLGSGTPLSPQISTMELHPDRNYHIADSYRNLDPIYNCQRQIAFPAVSSDERKYSIFLSWIKIICLKHL